MPKITIKGIRLNSSYQNSDFRILYEKLFSQDTNESESKHDFSYDDKKNILKWALFFFNSDDEGIKRLGYRIIVRYCVLFDNYVPLYDLSLNAGFIPVSKFIENRHLNKDAIQNRFHNIYLSAFKDIFKDEDNSENGYKYKYLSAGQKDMLEFSKSKKDDALLVAPTSYGKSEMMISTVADNLGKKICVIVPSKALLTQTKKRLLDNHNIASEAKRIITHPEMYREKDKTFIAVLTQERFFRLLQKHEKFNVDILLIDEAHNLLYGDDRGDLLLQIILIAKYRNPDIKLKFYTPVLSQPESIKTPYSNYNPEFKRVNEFIKIEKYFIYDANDTKTLKLYDQFLDKYILLATLESNVIDFVQKYKASKNIIYLNKPRNVEDVAKRLSDILLEINLSKILDGKFKNLDKSISDIIHKDYKLLTYLKKGVVYHHGKVPEIVRLYIERIFSKHPDFAFIVTSSTLLEGVNIPAERMFLLDVKRGRSFLSRSEFKNLTGRVCRFNDIFSAENGNLNMLEPEIYIVKGDYTNRRFKHETFFTKKAKWKDISEEKDENKNVLLDDNIDQTEEVTNKLQYIENIERGVLGENYGLGIKHVNSYIAKLCFKNSIHGFDIYHHESILEENLLRYESMMDKINNPNTLLEVISHIFINNIEYIKNNEFKRMKNQTARNFYSMVLKWRMKTASFNEMIGYFLSYWKERVEKNQPIIYVGTAWGEIKRTPDDNVNMYVNLRVKNNSQRVNLAIVRIKEEQDFIEYNLMKYIEVLNDLEMLDKSFYEKIKYGSSDDKKICLFKNGISIELAKILLDDKYKRYLEFLPDDQVKIDKNIISEMERGEENQLLIFEAEFHVA